MVLATDGGPPYPQLPTVTEGFNFFCRILKNAEAGAGMAAQYICDNVLEGSKVLNNMKKASFAFLLDNLVQSNKLLVRIHAEKDFVEAGYLVLSFNIAENRI